MFEDSMVLARVERSAGGRTRWLAAGSLAVQACLLAGIAALPLLHPAGLTARTTPPEVFLPIPKLPKVETARALEHASSSAAAMASPVRQLLAPPRIPHGIAREGEPAAPEIPMSFANTGFSGPGLPSVLAMGSPAPHIGVRPGSGTGATSPRHPLHVSSGVTAGLLLAPIRPVYPAIARAAHVEGTVLVKAIIGRDGRIESLQAVSGPEMLRSAAVEAIRAARYRPFLLNGEPTAVETSITVNFRMGG